MPSTTHSNLVDFLLSNLVLQKGNLGGTSLANVGAILQSIAVSPSDINQAELKNGEILEATVAHVSEEGEVKLSLKGIVVAAKTNVPLKAGDAINVRVEITTDTITLRILSNPEVEKVIESIKNLLPEKTDMGRLFERILMSGLFSADTLPDITEDTANSLTALKDLLNRIVVNGRELSEDVVRELFKKGGQFYEANLRNIVVSEKIKSAQQNDYGDDIVTHSSATSPSARASLIKLVREDLKPIIMSLIKELGENKPAAMTKILKDALSDILKNIELNQSINCLQAKQNTGYFQMPVYFDNRLEAAEIFFMGGKKRDRRQIDGEYGITISMDTQAFGRLVADARVNEGKINIQIYAGDRDSAEFIRGNLSLLKNGIESSGIAVNRMECAVRKKHPISDLPIAVSKSGLVDEFA